MAKQLFVLLVLPTKNARDLSSSSSANYGREHAGYRSLIRYGLPATAEH